MPFGLAVKPKLPFAQTAVTLAVAVATGGAFTVNAAVLAELLHPLTSVTVSVNVPPVVPKVTDGLCTLLPGLKPAPDGPDHT